MSQTSLKPKDYGVRFCRDGGVWYRLIPDGTWSRVTQSLAGDYLGIQMGVSAVPDKTGYCEIDHAIQDIVAHYGVDFVGKYAGYLRAGDYLLPDGFRMLITHNVKLIEPVEGDFDLVINFLGAAFPAEDQLEAFLGWLQWAVRTLRENQPSAHRPACWANRRAAIIVGDPGNGKTALQQDIITPCLTGRFADPSIYLTDKTTFTGQLAEAEHWMMSDPGWSEQKERRSFLHKSKQVVANSDMTAHPKGKQAVDLPTYRLLTITLNRDKATLEDILPLMPASTMEKILWLDFESPGRWAPNGEGGPCYIDWKRTIQAELPGFLWWLLNDFQIPKRLQHARYGINYTHPRFTTEFAAKTMEETDQETQEVIYDFLAHPYQTSRHTYTAAQLLGQMQSFDSKVRERAKFGEFSNSKKFLGALRRWIAAGGQCDGFTIEQRQSGRMIRFYFTCDALATRQEVIGDYGPNGTRLTAQIGKNAVTRKNVTTM